MMTAAPVTVVATARAKSGKEAALRGALLAVIAPTRKEAGCLNYDLHIAPDDPARFCFHENWESQAHLDAHLKMPHIAALFAQVEELCAEPPQISLWRRIA
jgi:quinol monooxygenase YgiN